MGIAPLNMAENTGASGVIITLLVGVIEDNILLMEEIRRSPVHGRKSSSKIQRFQLVGI